MATIEDRFRAAVNVIKGLPKNGPYQPSTAMMLKFYGLFKQGTEGPCTNKKPAFWDVIGKAKWDAWNDNRHLSKEQAMLKYVEGLREIIETMSFTQNVADFVGSLNSLDSINLDELEMIAPGMREMAESHPNSPFHSRTNSPQHGVSANSPATATTPSKHNGAATTNDGDDDESPTTSSVASEEVLAAVAAATPTASTNTTTMNGHCNGIEKIETPVAAAAFPTAPTSTQIAYAVSNSTVDQSDDEYGDPIDIQHEFTEAMMHNSELLKQIQATVLRMNADMVTVNQRMSVLEKSVQEVRTAVLQQRTHKSANTHSSGNSSSRSRLGPNWWPFDDISPAWFVMLVLWPFVVRRLSNMLRTQRRK